VTQYEILTITLAVVVGMVIPALVLLIRGTVRWVRIEDKLEDLSRQLAGHVHPRVRSRWWLPLTLIALWRTRARD
jgi:hypothetical protein